MTELKPCPFCGRTPTVDDCGEHRYFVRCKCGIVQDKLYMQKCDAVRRWNTRKIDKDTNVPSNDCISRQVAIDAINSHFGFNIEEEYGSAVQEVINSLPAAQPEPSQIARDIATIIENEQDMRVILAQPQRMRGRWQEITASDCSGYDPVLAGYDDPVVGYVCSTCHEGYEKEVMGKVTWNYCPKCGADMREGEG